MQTCSFICRSVNVTRTVCLVVIENFILSIQFKGSYVLTCIVLLNDFNIHFVK